MKIKALCSRLLAVSATTLYSASLLAQETEEVITEPSAINYTPLILLAVVLVLLKNKLIAEATPESHGDEGHHHEPEAKAAPSQVPVPTPVPAKPAAASAAPAPAVASSTLIDASAGAEQCQGTTAKGARCSRSTNLETIEMTVNGKNYRFSTCKQHNNDSFKPFWSCLSGGKGGN